MSSNNTTPNARIDGTEPTNQHGPRDSVVAVEVEDGVVLYDEEQPGAWITSTITTTIGGQTHE